MTKLNIEAETAASIARTMLLPAAARHLALLLEAQLGELAGETSDLIAEFMRDNVVPAMAAMREYADRLEKVVADDLWPLPKYSEILFIK